VLLECFEGIVNYGYIEKRSYDEDFDSDSSSASVQSNAVIWNVHNSEVVFSPTVLSVYSLTVENWCKAWVKTSARFFRGATASSASSCCATAGALMTLCQKFISYRRVQSKKAVLQEVMLIDSYSCSCAMLVMLLCTCCEWFDLYDFMPFCLCSSGFCVCWYKLKSKQCKGDWLLCTIPFNWH